MQTRSKSNKSGNKFQTNHVTSIKNPLYIPEIADHIFDFLKLPDIKNCRSVCQKWNQLAEKFIKKLSVVNISKPEIVEKFNQEFPNAQRSKIFSCFRVGCPAHLFQWRVYKSDAFFKKWYNNLTEISLLKLDFRGGKNAYHLSPLLPSTLNKLHIESCIPKMILATDKICNIRILQLEECILNVMPGTTLNNVEIHLDDVTFCQGKERINEFLINPLLNFDVLKKASFGGVNIMLDFQGSHSLDMLKLQTRVKVLNWKTSNWEIRKLFLHTKLCVEVEDELSKSPVKYKELEITLKKVNVSLLPEGIEKLQIELCNYGPEVVPRIYGEHSFLHLKHLHITLMKWDDFSPFVDFFKHCPKLTILTVQLSFPLYNCRGETILNTSSLPSSVKTLRVNDVKVVVDQNLKLDSLILNYYELIDAQCKDTGAQLSKENSVWLLNSFDNHLIVFDKERGNNFKNLIDLKLDNLVVGTFPLVNNSEFKKSFLFPLVDKQGQYYLFQRGEKGKAISDRDAKMYQNAEESDCFQIK